MESIIRVFASGTPPAGLGVEQQRCRQVEEKRRKSQKRSIRRRKTQLAKQVLDVVAQKTILDDPRADDAALMLAIVSLEQLGDLPEEVFRRTLVGRSLNKVWRRENGTTVGKRARALLEVWKDSFRKSRASVAASADSGSAQAEDSAGAWVLPQTGATEVSVTSVKYSNTARRRLARQASAARKEALPCPPVVEECIDVDSDSPSAETSEGRVASLGEQPSAAGRASNLGHSPDAT